MADVDQLLRQARSELTLERPNAPADLILWEHSLRVMGSAEMIQQLPELVRERIDRDAVRVTALYHDAGWAAQVGLGQVARERVLTRPTNDVQFELAAELVESSLGQQLPPRTVQRAAQAIRGISDRQCELLEAHVVADADNLDQIGPLGLLQNLRRDVVEGRSLREVLHAWEQQKEYRFWEARIRDGIRLESVRELAWRRLAAMGPFMQALAQHIEAHDLAELAGIPAPDKTKRPQTAS